MSGHPPRSPLPSILPAVHGRRDAGLISCINAGERQTNSQWRTVAVIAAATLASTPPPPPTHPPTHPRMPHSFPHRHASHAATANKTQVPQPSANPQQTDTRSRQRRTKLDYQLRAWCAAYRSNRQLVASLHSDADSPPRVARACATESHHVQERQYVLSGQFPPPHVLPLSFTRPLCPVTTIHRTPHVCPSGCNGKVN